MTAVEEGAGLLFWPQFPPESKLSCHLVQKRFQGLQQADSGPAVPAGYCSCQNHPKATPLASKSTHLRVPVQPLQPQHKKYLLLQLHYAQAQVSILPSACSGWPQTLPRSQSLHPYWKRLSRKSLHSKHLPLLNLFHRQSFENCPSWLFCRRGVCQAWQMDRSQRTTSVC